MLKIEVTKYIFVDAFKSMNREEQFSYEGKCALFSYLTELSKECDEDIELDIISLCCDYTETTLNDFLKENPDSDCKTLEDIQDSTAVIVVDEDSENPKFIYANF